jgi:tRNA-splicing ligase RtcB
VQRLGEKLVSWASVVDDNTLEQARTSSLLPFIWPHVALMPDAHYGMGATIGSVIPTRGAIIPAAVGVDIGCGMQAMRTDLERMDLTEEWLKAFRKAVRDTIPTGIGKSGANAMRTERVIGLGTKLLNVSPEDPKRFTDRWEHQLGSLGSGNHFLELDVDEEKRVWVTLHTGSRAIGMAIANHYTALAQELCKRWFVELPDKDLAFLPTSENAGKAYLAWMSWAQSYARANRDEIMERALTALKMVFKSVEGTERFDCHHNFAALEHHWETDLWITRKGAVRARSGDVALIPGSMGTPSYIMEGKGSRLGFDSAPHGAGRRMSRRKAFENLTLDGAREKMTGILWDDRQAVLDETPEAYKDIEVVIKDAAELLEVKHTLTPVLNIKG